MRIAAWSESGAIKNPGPWVKAALDANLSEVQLIVNDGLSKRGQPPKPFHIKHEKHIPAAVKRFHDAGIDVSFMTWVLPNDEWLDGILFDLFPIAVGVGASAVELDAEEPWTKAKKGHERFVQRWTDNRPFSRHFPVGVNAIVSTNKARLAMLADFCDYVCAQGYATNMYGSKTYKRGGKVRNQYKRPMWYPGQMQHSAYGVYEPLFGATKVKQVLGVNAFWLAGAGDMSAKRALCAQLDAAENIGFDMVRLWSLRWLKGSSAKRRWIKEWLAR